MTEREQWPSIEGLSDWVIKIMEHMRLIKIEDVQLSDEWKDKL